MNSYPECDVVSKMWVENPNQILIWVEDIIAIYSHQSVILTFLIKKSIKIQKEKHKIGHG